MSGLLPPQRDRSLVEDSTVLLDPMLAVIVIRLSVGSLEVMKFKKKSTSASVQVLEQSRDHSRH